MNKINSNLNQFHIKYAIKNIDTKSQYYKQYACYGNVWSPLQGMRLGTFKEAHNYAIDQDIVGKYRIVKMVKPKIIIGFRVKFSDGDYVDFMCKSTGETWWMQDNAREFTNLNKCKLVRLIHRYVKQNKKSSSSPSINEESNKI